MRIAIAGAALFAALTSIALPAVAGEGVRMDERGQLRVDDLAFYVDCRFAKRNYRQGAREFKVARTAPGRAAGELRLPDQPAGRFEAALAETGDGQYGFKASMEFPGPVRVETLALRVSLPADRYAGAALKVDGADVVLPAGSGKTPVHTVRNGRELVIPLAGGRLRLRGAFSLNVHDYRPGQNLFNLIIAFTPSWGELSRSDLALELSREIPRSTPIDLRSVVNMGFADPVADDGKGGWSDQGPDNDLSMLPVGRRRWHGVEVDVIDPAANGGLSCLMLRGLNRPAFAERAGVDIAGDVRGACLYLVHALAWPAGTSEVGRVTAIYRDGEKQVFDIAKNREAGNWWSPSPRKNGDLVWTGENRSAFVGLFRSRFDLRDAPLARLEFESAGQSVWGVVAASAGDPPTLNPTPPPHYIVAGKDWRPFDYHKDVLPGSALDLSPRLDAPAGKHGPVVIRDGRFEFRDRPGIPARFYGTNLCSSAPFPPDRAWAERLADRMAAFGFNLVRLHHHDGGTVSADDPARVRPNPENLEKLDYLLHCLKQRGVYVTTDLYVSRRLPKGGIPGFDGDLANIQAYKAMLWIDDAFFDNWKDYTRTYLAHVNPHTGLALKDDPALVSISLVNEGNIHSHWNTTTLVAARYTARFDEWRKAKGLADADAAGRNRQFEAFLGETYGKRYAEMKDFVRGLGLSCPLTDQNMGSFTRLSALRAAYDYVDNHGYWSHPSFAEKSWQLPSLLRNRSAIAQDAANPARMFPSRLAGKPFAVTEFDFAKPNAFRAEGPALFGAYAGLQDWGMLVQFAYAHGLDNYTRDDRTANHFDLSTDPVKALSQRIGAALFTGGGVKPAPRGLAVRLAEADLGFRRDYPAILQRLGLVARVATLPPGAPDPDPERWTVRPFADFVDAKDALPDGVAEALGLAPGDFDAAAGRYRARTGQLTLDRAKETFAVAAPDCEALVLPASAEGAGDFLRVANRSGRAVFAAVSPDGKPLREASRLLLLHLTDSQASKTRYGDARKERLETWGETPFLASKGEADIFLRPAPGSAYAVHALDTSGRRLAEIPVARAENGEIRFAARIFHEQGPAFAYELVHNPAGPE